MIHGGMHTGVTWETTPDGREGWQTLFVRAGFETLVVDQVCRGRSAPDLDALNPHLGEGGTPGRSFTTGAGMGARFARGGHRFDLSPDNLHRYGGQLAPDLHIHDAWDQGRPGLSDPRNQPPLLALIDRIGPVVLITHSQGGDVGWRAAIARPEGVKAIVAIEPALVTPGLDDPAFPPIPVRVMWGDNLPAEGALLSRQQVAETRALAAERPWLEIDVLAEDGFPGNGHMLMMEDNNADIAARVMDWLSARCA
jgi:pimeloyl-ACP methyl ester carboxylesterase